MVVTSCRKSVTRSASLDILVLRIFTATGNYEQESKSKKYFYGGFYGGFSMLSQHDQLKPYVPLFTNISSRWCMNLCLLTNK